jgi:WD40 repeat protein
VQRYLAGEPISAKRDSAWYVLRKTLRRHRAPLAVVTGFLVLAVTFGLTMAALYGLSERHRAAAEDAAERLGAELAFSSIERGRLLSRGEQAPVAEALIWTTWLERAGATRAPERASAAAIERQAYWALWGLYHRHPALSTLSIGTLCGVAFSDRAVIVANTDYEDGLYRPVVRLHGLADDAVAGPGEVWRSDHLALWRSGAMSLDGQALAYADEDHTVVLDARTRDVLADRPGEGSWAVALSSPSRGDVRLARIPLDRRGVVELSNLSRDPPLITLAAAGDADAGQGVELWYPDISADGRVIAAADRHAVHVWDASDEGTTRRASVRFKPEDGLTSRLGVLSGLALHPDGSVLATVFGSALDLWDTRDGRHVARLPAVSTWATDCRFSPDGRRIASFGGDRLIQVWDVESRMLTGVFAGHLDLVKSLALSADGSMLVTADGSGMAKVWDLARPCGVESKIVPELSNHSVRFSADGAFLATCGLTRDPTVRQRGSVHVWRLETGERIDLLCGHDTVSDVEFLPDASQLAASSHDGVVRVWSLPDQQERMRIEVCPGVSGKDVGASSVCLSPDGALVAAAGNDGAVHLWDAADGRRVATLQHGDADAVEFHARRLPQARFDPSGRLLASVCADHSVMLWDVASQQGRRLAGHEGTVRCAAFNPDGRLLATGGDDRRVLLWDAVAAAPRGAIGQHSSSIFALSFSPDGRVLAAGGADGSATLWDVATGRQLLALDDCAAMIMALDFSRDGSKLAAASSTEGVVIWNLHYYDRHIAGNLAAQQRASQGR